MCHCGGCASRDNDRPVAHTPCCGTLLLLHVRGCYPRGAPEMWQAHVHAAGVVTACQTPEHSLCKGGQWYAIEQDA
jgi:hypothetical protein